MEPTTAETVLPALDVSLSLNVRRLTAAWAQEVWVHLPAPWSAADVRALLALGPVGVMLAALAFIGVTLVLEGAAGPSGMLLITFTARCVALVFP
jgi:hypothetical protein